MNKFSIVVGYVYKMRLTKRGVSNEFSALVVGYRPNPLMGDQMVMDFYNLSNMHLLSVSMIDGCSVLDNDKFSLEVLEKDESKSITWNSKLRFLVGKDYKLHTVTYTKNNIAFDEKDVIIEVANGFGSESFLILEVGEYSYQAKFTDNLAIAKTEYGVMLIYLE